MVFEAITSIVESFTERIKHNGMILMVLAIMEQGCGGKFSYTISGMTSFLQFSLETETQNENLPANNCQRSFVSRR